MKRRYCINIDKCIVLPMAAPLGWSIFLLGLFLITLFISLGKGECSQFFESIAKGWAIWLYLSSPISLAAFALISIGFIVFPVSYVEVGDESIRVHRAFKKDRILRYEEVHYVRLNKSRKSEWIFLFAVASAAGEINTIEIRKDYPFPSFWFSSSSRAYKVIMNKFKLACSGKKELTEGDCYVAESHWVAEHGNPQEVTWGGHYGQY